MPAFKTLSAAFLVLVTGLALVPLATAADLRTYYDSLEARYTRAHSLGDGYRFDSRDGWETVNVTDLAYKYRRREDTFGLGGTADEPGSEGSDYLNKRSSKKSKSHSKSKSKLKLKAQSNSKSKTKSKTKSTNHVKAPSKESATKSFTNKVSGLGKIVDSIKGVGKPEPVTITWYTGHDLLNPSCWSNPVWAPTDNSFAAALTLEGWTTKPKCFKFLELCNSPQKCVFVRVVDSCAGCAKASKHVDLTQAAFKELADLDTGLLTVEMRPATDPMDGWLEDLWGPKS
ncbi:hypothetical protein BDY19DRAFT_927405 [Irpex rosettiformis]|uniref:Uncharacterized protein n=1 Tax=Irpex rosettiformis TaxID=378272 RepID=A0ACB8UC94_9APHY|nr:hypothetical protein BDY19DRAFT_927405 [Irpex rosettiformis]